MVRVTKPTTQTVISKPNFGDAIIDDYASLTDTAAQNFIGVFRPTGPATYTIFKDGSDYYVIDLHQNTVYGGNADKGGVDGADPDAVLASAVTALPTTGGNIFVKSPFAGTTLTITKSNVHIYCLDSKFPAWNFATINKVLFDSNAGAIEDVSFTGFYHNMIDFYSRNSHTISKIHFNYPYIESKATATTEGIVFRGDDTEGTFRVYFNHPFFLDGGQSARAGFISLLDNSGNNGQYFFEHANYLAGSVTNPVLLAIEEGGKTSPITAFDHLDCHCPSGKTSFTLVKVLAQNNAARRAAISFLNIHDSWIECQTAATLFSLANGSEDVWFYSDFHDNFMDDGATITAFANANTHWNSYLNGVQIHHCGWQSKTGTLGTVGTLPVKIYGNYGLADA